MSKINWARVLLGGLLAGLVLNLLGMTAAHLFLGEELHALHHRLDLPTPGTSQFAVHLGIRFALGIVLVWFYAAIRPRFGPGPRTAIIASTAVWLMTSVMFFAAMGVLGLFSSRIVCLALAWGFLEFQIASQAGAWLYREP